MLTGNKVSVGPPFFNATFVPICAPLFAALCVGPFLGWKRAELWPALLRLRVAFVAAVIAAIVAATVIDGRATLAAVGLRLRRLADRGQPDASSTSRTRRAPHPPRAARPSLGMTISHARAGRRRAGRGGDRVVETPS